MISLTQRLVSAGLLATAAFAVSAQTAGTPVTTTAAPVAESTSAQPAARKHDGKSFQRMQERHAKHQVELKGKLKLDAAQEAAWTTYTAALKPPARPAANPDRAAQRADFAKLTTPERLDRMQARQTERSARFAQRADATKTFYATLNAEQQKTFDAESLRRGHRGGAHHHGQKGHRAAPAPAAS